MLAYLYALEVFVKNKLVDLNNHLFSQLERLSEGTLTPERLAHEVSRADAIVGIADQVIRIAAIQVQAAKIISDAGNDPAPYLPEPNSKPKLPILRVVEGSL